MDSGKSVAGKQSKPSHFDAAPFLVAAASVFITPEPGMSQSGYQIGQENRAPFAVAAGRLTTAAAARKALAFGHFARGVGRGLNRS
jgi:hypothetical protein